MLPRGWSDALIHMSDCRHLKSLSSGKTQRTLICKRSLAMRTARSCSPSTMPNPKILPDRAQPGGILHDIPYNMCLPRVPPPYAKKAPRRTSPTTPRTRGEASFMAGSGGPGTQHNTDHEQLSEFYYALVLVPCRQRRRTWRPPRTATTLFEELDGHATSRRRSHSGHGLS